VMELLEIKEYGKNEGRQLLIFDDGTKLVASPDIIADFRLFAGKTLEPEELEDIKSAFSSGETRKRAERIIARRAMSKKELIDRLREKGESPENAEDAASWMEELGVINDREYASMVVRHYSGKGYGRMRIRNELHRRGVGKALWDGALEEMPKMDDTIDRFIRTKLMGMKADRREKKRVSDALFRRGYSWDEINSAFRRYEESVEE